MMSASNANDNLFDDMQNPLDGIEDILIRQNWTYSRMNRDELYLELKGKHGVYRMMFLWEESHEVMQLCAEFDLRLADFQYAKACQMINEINGKLWLGNFHLSPETMIPCFRHTQMLRGVASTADVIGQMEDLIQITMDDCDLHYPAFLMLASEKTHDEDQLALALMPAVGLS